MYAAAALSASANEISALFRQMREAGTDAGFFAANPGPYHDPLELMRAARLDAYVTLEKRYSVGPY